MPGHMNVLLAEANVPYEQLVEPQDVNPTMETANVAIVIGANERTLTHLGDQDFENIYLYPNSHAGYYPGIKTLAINIPPPELHAHLDEFPRDREINVFCRSGQRAYYATCILLQSGFKAHNISGGMLSRWHLVVDWSGEKLETPGGAIPSQISKGRELAHV
jgi:rhodanese-related sulfurtransferase